MKKPHLPCVLFGTRIPEDWFYALHDERRRLQQAGSAVTTATLIKNAFADLELKTRKSIATLATEAGMSRSDYVRHMLPKLFPHLNLKYVKPTSVKNPVVRGRRAHNGKYAQRVDFPASVFVHLAATANKLGRTVDEVIVAICRAHMNKANQQP